MEESLNVLNSFHNASFVMAGYEVNNEHGFIETYRVPLIHSCHRSTEDVKSISL